MHYTSAYVSTSYNGDKYAICCPSYVHSLLAAMN
jgi:hypothetical protein